MSWESRFVPIVQEWIVRLFTRGWTRLLRNSSPGSWPTLRAVRRMSALEDLLKTIRGKVERFNVDKIRQEDIVASGGGAPDEE